MCGVAFRVEVPDSFAMKCKPEYIEIKAGVPPPPLVHKERQRPIDRYT